MRPLSFILITVSLLGLAGCNTFERRAEKRADVFATLPPETKTRLEKQDIQLGDTVDMVYIALGNPDEQQQTTTATGETITWVYNRYWQEYRGEAYGGVQPRTIKDPKTGAVSTYLEPVSRPIYTERQQPILKIVFTGGKISVIEKAKN
jgi:hypothetical protein